MVIINGPWLQPEATSPWPAWAMGPWDFKAPEMLGYNFSYGEIDPLSSDLELQ